MKILGVDSENSLFYEKVSGFSYGVIPQPNAIPLSFGELSKNGSQNIIGEVGPGVSNVDYLLMMVMSQPQEFVEAASSKRIRINL